MGYKLRRAPPLLIGWIKRLSHCTGRIQQLIKNVDDLRVGYFLRTVVSLKTEDPNAYLCFGETRRKNWLINHKRSTFWVPHVRINSWCNVPHWPTESHQVKRRRRAIPRYFLGFVLILSLLQCSQNWPQTCCHGLDTCVLTYVMIKMKHDGN